MAGLTYAEAIGKATVDAMESDPSIVLLGSGVTDFRGVFGTTLEAAQRFPGRVFDVPNSEAALGGIVCGLASQGMHPLWVHHRIDFMTYCFDPIVNLLAKWSAMYQADPLPVTIRTIVGRGWGQGPTHSQFLGSTFAHFPGLTVAAPHDARGAQDVLGTFLQTTHPCLMVEHRALYPLGTWTRGPIRWGRKEESRAATIVSCSAGVRAATLAGQRLWVQYGIAVEVVPVDYLQPLLVATVLRSLETTRRLVVLDPGWGTYGFSAEILACVAESVVLDAPPVRVAPPDVPAPTSAPLEAAYWPGAAAVVQAVLRVLGREEQPERCIACQNYDHDHCMEAPCPCPCWDRGTWRTTGALRPDAFTGPY